MNTIESTIAGYFNVDPEDILTRNRQRDLVKPRHIIWYFLNKEGQSLEQIAKRYGLKSQSVRKGINILIEKSVRNSEYRNQIATIKAIFEAKRVEVDQEKRNSLIESITISKENIYTMASDLHLHRPKDTSITNQIINEANSLKRLQVEYKRLSEL